MNNAWFLLLNSPPLFTEACSDQIEVKIGQDLKATHKKLAGNYKANGGAVNGLPYWLKGDQAIWFQGAQWHIGLKANLRNKTNASPTTLHSKITQSCPESKNVTWTYFKNNKLMEVGNDTQVQELEGKSAVAG